MIPHASFKAVRLLEFPTAVDVSAVFGRLRTGSHPWLLDSSGKPGVPSLEQARYSFFGADPYLVLRAFGTRNVLRWREALRADESWTGDPLSLVRRLLGPSPQSVAMCAGSNAPLPDPLPPFLCGAVGSLGYELDAVAVSKAESLEVEVGAARERASGLPELDTPDVSLLFVDRLIAVDHLRDRSFAVGLGFGEDRESASAAAEASARTIAEAASLATASLAATTRSVDSHPEKVGTDRSPILDAALPPDVQSSLTREAYEDAVGAIQESIACGDVYQVNLTQRLDLPMTSTAKDADLGWALYRELAGLSPAPFSAYLELPDACIVSSSPERFLKLDRDGGTESRPIKGTRPRGGSRAEDALLAKELAESIKDRAENLMIVDLVRNDLGRVCATGSVEVSELMAIERYANVFQMVSTIRGKLAPPHDAIDLVRATWPPGSMTGAPKLAAMKIIRQLEPLRRGIYSGALGYFDVFGGLDLSVVIRTLLVVEGRVHVHGGGAIVSDSSPRDEWLESIDKVRALLAAVDCVEPDLECDVPCESTGPRVDGHLP